MYCGHSRPHDSRAPAAHADVHGFAISPIRVVFYALIIYQRFIRIPHSRLKVSTYYACFLLSAFFSSCTPSAKRLLLYAAPTAYPQIPLLLETLHIPILLLSAHDRLVSRYCTRAFKSK